MGLATGIGGRLARRAAGVGAVAAGGWLARRAARAPAGAAPALPPAVAGEALESHGRAGRLRLYAAGRGGPPLLLVHSINAAASAYEVRPIFEPFATRRRTFAVDLPGFGASDRSERRYDVRLYVDAIHDALDRIEAEAGPVPVDALAVSLSSEFLARAAVERPARFRTLALVTPTGFGRPAKVLNNPAGGTREVPGLHAAVSFRLWDRQLYNALTSRRSIRYFLQRTFGSKAIDEGLLDYDVLTARQPGARHAPFAFISGRLFSLDNREVYQQLMLPVWMPHATRGDFGSFAAADWARAAPNWTVEPFETGALPHFERPAEFLAAYGRFLARAPAPAAATAPA